MTREQLVAKIEETSLAIKKTKSVMCKRDLTKSLYRMKKELRDYDMFQNQNAMR